VKAVLYDKLGRTVEWQSDLPDPVPLLLCAEWEGEYKYFSFDRMVEYADVAVYMEG